MKLLLTSAGFMNTKIAQAFAGLLSKPMEQCSIALIPTGARSVEERFYVQESQEELERLGLGTIVELDASDPLEPTLSPTTEKRSRPRWRS
jgi:peptidase E